MYRLLVAAVQRSSESTDDRGVGDAQVVAMVVVLGRAVRSMAVAVAGPSMVDIDSMLLQDSVVTVLAKHNVEMGRW